MLPKKSFVNEVLIVPALLGINFHFLIFSDQKQLPGISGAPALAFTV